MIAILHVYVIREKTVMCIGEWITYILLGIYNGEKMYYWYIFCFFNSSLVTRFVKTRHQWLLIGDAFCQTVSPIAPHWWRVLEKDVTNDPSLVTRFAKTRHQRGVIGDARNPRHQCDSHRWRKFSDTNFFRHQLAFFRVSNDEFWHSEVVPKL